MYMYIPECGPQFTVASHSEKVLCVRDEAWHCLEITSTNDCLI